MGIDCNVFGAPGSLQKGCLSIFTPDILSASQSETFSCRAMFQLSGV